MLVDTNYCFRKNHQIIYKEIGSDAALIDPYRRILLRLNPMALEIWQLLDGEHSVAAIIKMLRLKFEVDVKKLEKDVFGFLKDLIRREMIK